MTHNCGRTSLGKCQLKQKLIRVFIFAAIDYIHFLHKEKKKQEEEVSVLRKEVMALKIMKT